MNQPNVKTLSYNGITIEWIGQGLYGYNPYLRHYVKMVDLAQAEYFASDGHTLYYVTEKELAEEGN